MQAGNFATEIAHCDSGLVVRCGSGYSIDTKLLRPAIEKSSELWTLIHAPEGKPMWLSSHQLFLVFQQTTGQVGIVRKQPDRCWRQLQVSDLDEFDFCSIATDFTFYVKAIMKSTGSTIHTSKRRPSGVAYRKWLCCMHVQIPHAHLLAVDQLLETCRVSPVLYVRKAFQGFRGVFVSRMAKATVPEPFGLDVACVPQAAVTETDGDLFRWISGPGQVNVRNPSGDFGGSEFCRRK